MANRREVTKIDIEGSVSRLIAADDKLFAVTTSGKLIAFGDEPPKPPEARDRAVATSLDKVVEPLSVDSTARAKAILDVTGIHEGYGLVYGCGESDLAAAVAQESKLNLTVFEPAAAKCSRCGIGWMAWIFTGNRSPCWRVPPSRPICRPIFRR